MAALAIVSIGIAASADGGSVFRGGSDGSVEGAAELVEWLAAAAAWCRSASSRKTANPGFQAASSGWPGLLHLEEALAPRQLEVAPRRLERAGAE